MAAAAATLGGCLGTAQASVMDGVDVTMGVHSAHGQRPASLRAPQRNMPSVLAFVPEKAFGALDVDPGSSISHARTRRAIELEQRLEVDESFYPLLIMIMIKRDLWSFIQARHNFSCLLLV